MQVRNATRTRDKWLTFDALFRREDRRRRSSETSSAAKRRTAMTTIRLQGNVEALMSGRGQAMACTNADFEAPNQVICELGLERLARDPPASARDVGA